MSDPSGGDGRTADGCLVGFVYAALAVPVSLFFRPVGWVLIGVMVVGALVLISRGDPFRVGVGAGVLVAGALVALVGACFSSFAEL